MSGPHEDPFAALGRLPDPEPDPEVRKATIAASREAFMRQTAPQPRAGWLDRLRAGLGSPRNWLMPVGVTAFGAIAAVAILPDLMAPLPTQTKQVVSEDAAPPVMERLRQAVPAPPIAAAPSQTMAEPAQAEAQASRQSEMMAASPDAAQAPAPIGGPAMTVFNGDGVQIGAITEGGMFRLYRIENGIETLLETRAGAGPISVVTAVLFVPADDGAEIVAVETRDGDGTQWDAYRDGVRDDGLSARIADAPNPAEVERRLAGEP